MHSRQTLLGCLIGLCTVAAAGCGTREPSEDESAPQITVETDGNVTAVRNAGGSIWGASGRLTEEASIGVEEGAEPYMLGTVLGIAASDERIYVLDSQAIKLRAYDLQGTYVGDIGRQGGGPGEFRRPWELGISEKNHLFVRDLGQNRMLVYSEDGAPIIDWRIPRASWGTVTRSGFVYMVRERFILREPDGPPATVTAYGPNGALGEWTFPDLEFVPPVLDVTGNQLEMMAVFLGLDGSWREQHLVPFAPNIVIDVAPSGAMIVGTSNAYRFEVHEPVMIDGELSPEVARTLVVEKAWQPVPVASDEATWYRRRLTANWRAVIADWTWIGPGIPDQKAAYRRIIPDHDGRLWVVREVEGEQLPDCDPRPDDYDGFVENPCWRQPMVADVFDLDGRFLGDVPLPDGVRYHIRPFIRDDMFVALVQDDYGIQYVKRYRLDLAE